MIMRKFRNLSNARWFKTKRQAIASSIKSEKAQARVNPNGMMKCSIANQTPEAMQKRIQAVKQYYIKRPDFQSNRMRHVYKMYPHLLELARVRIKAIIAILSTSRDGVQVIRKVFCQREKSVGVDRYYL